MFAEDSPKLHTNVFWLNDKINKQAQMKQVRAGFLTFESIQWFNSLLQTLHLSSEGFLESLLVS